MGEGFLIISGCPRSGVSLCMDVHEKVLGKDSMVGIKYPLKEQFEKKDSEIERMPEEKDSAFRVRKYLIEKKRALNKLKENDELKNYNANNSDFYWSSIFTNKGITFNSQFKELFDAVRDGKSRVCKISNRGLISTDPNDIDKIIYMIRHPKEVAKSLELLRRDSPDLLALGKKEPLFASDIYIQEEVAAINFFLKNPEVPVHFVNHNELLSDPKKVLDEIQEFVGVGDYSKAYDLIDSELSKSRFESVKDDVWQEEIQKAFTKKQEVEKSLTSQESVHLTIHL